LAPYIAIDMPLLLAFRWLAHQCSRMHEIGSVRMLRLELAVLRL
jgi:hypothetical protein